MRFQDIPGQEALKQHLIASVRQGRVPHAQLFVGADESGTLPMMLAYAQYLQCTQRTETDSCGCCPACRQMSQYMHPEVHFIFPVVKKRSDKPALSEDQLPKWREALTANPYLSYNDWMEYIKDGEKQGGIFVEESAALLEKLAFVVSGARYKIVMVWMADRMGTSPANKLLKILEEPNERTVFLLSAPSTQDMLPTVVSRTQIVRVPPLGGVQQAGSERGRQYFKYFVSMMRTAYMAFNRNPDKNEMQHLYEWAAEMAQTGREEQKCYIQYALRLIRESYLMTMGMAALTVMSDEERAFVGKFAPFVNSRNVEDIFSLLNDAARHIEGNVNQTLVFFDTGLQMALCLHR